MMHSVRMTFVRERMIRETAIILIDVDDDVAARFDRNPKELEDWALHSVYPTHRYGWTTVSPPLGDGPFDGWTVTVATSIYKTEPPEQNGATTIKRENG